MCSMFSTTFANQSTEALRLQESTLRNVLSRWVLRGCTLSSMTILICSDIQYHQNVYLPTGRFVSEFANPPDLAGAQGASISPAASDQAHHCASNQTSSSANGCDKHSAGM